MALKPTPFNPALVEHPEGYPYGFDVMWVTEDIHDSIHQWLLLNLGPRDGAWKYDYDFRTEYAAFWLRDPDDALAFKMRWL